MAFNFVAAFLPKCYLIIVLKKLGNILLLDGNFYSLVF